MTIDTLTDAAVAGILKDAKTIALVGASEKPGRASHRVMAYMLARGYDVYPVNPGLAGKELHGRKVYASLADVPPPIDMVEIFRASDAVPDTVREALAEQARLGLKYFWMQLGVINEQAADKARAAGLIVVMDRCPKIEIPRLFRD